jgi:hypothetical protein
MGILSSSFLGLHLPIFKMGEQGRGSLGGPSSSSF